MPTDRRQAQAKDPVIVGLSGGVDSAVTAALLQEQGFAVHAVFMVNWDQDDSLCTSRQDYRDAQAVADTLGIPLSQVNFADVYWDRVFSHFLSELEQGRTPNPDILCNREVKFRAFLDHAIHTMQAPWVATGHYARVDHSPPHASHLLQAADSNKDQTYFLHAISQQALNHTLFPLGDLAKDEVRRIAQKRGLHNHSKRDSTGICFIGEGKFREFLQRYLPHQPGDIVDSKENIIGQHQGLMYYTLGQRKGLGIGGISGNTHSPWFVLAKKRSSNQLIVGQEADIDCLYSDHVQLESGHWFCQPDDIAQDTLTGGSTPLHARIRHRGPLEPCHIQRTANGAWQVNFQSPVRAATPGQSLVLYHNERCLGGAVINNVSAISKISLMQEEQPFDVQS